MHYYVTPEIAQEFERCLAKRGLGAEAHVNKLTDAVAMLALWITIFDSAECAESKNRHFSQKSDTNGRLVIGISTISPTRRKKSALFCFCNPTSNRST
jgi:hypothetical protein